MKLSSAAQRVIELAQKTRAYYEAELPKHHPKYPLVSVLEEEPPAPPEKQQLKQFLASLSDEMVYQLLLIMCLGRGDFEANDLAASYEALKSTFGKAEWAVAQMMEKAPLAEYLSDGLEQLTQHQINVDHLALRKPRTRK